MNIQKQSLCFLAAIVGSILLVNMSAIAQSTHSKKGECPKTVSLNFTPTAFPGQNPDFSTFEEPWLGWWVIDADGRWTPARNVVIRDHQKVAIHLGGTGGGLTLLGQLLQSFEKYDVVLGIRYDTTASISQVTGDFLTERLLEILKLQNVKIDMFPFSMGSVALRWALEVNELGKYKQFKHVVLIGEPAQGTLSPDMFPDQNSGGGLATAINNAVEATTDVDSLALATTNSPTTTITDDSNNIPLPAPVINVVSTSGLPISGVALVTTTAGVQVVSYTGLTPTSFIGTTGGTGTMLTGNSVVIPVFKDAVLFLLGAQFDQFKGNAQLDSKLPGPVSGGEAIKLVNNHNVSPKTFCNLKYYVINGFDFNLFAVSDLNAFYNLGPNGRPYAFIGQYIYGITDPSTLALLESWDTIYLNLGALSNFAASQVNTVPQPFPYDGLIPTRLDILTEKSKFFRDHRYLAEILVPENHFGIASSTGGAPISPFMQSVYENLVNSFDY